MECVADGSAPYVGVGGRDTVPRWGQSQEATRRPRTNSDARLRYGYSELKLIACQGHGSLATTLPWLASLAETRPTRSISPHSQSPSNSTRTNMLTNILPLKPRAHGAHSRKHKN